MISRPGPLSLDASSRLNHRAFASVINLVPLESTIRWVSLALFFYDIEGQPSAGSVSQQKKRGLSDAEGVPSGSLNFRSERHVHHDEPIRGPAVLPIDRFTR
jgi:hypothetical protein